MSFRTRFIMFASVLVAVFAFSSLGFGQTRTDTDSSTPATPQTKPADQRGFGKGGFGGHGFRGHRHGDRMMGGAMRGVTLTDDQKTQIHNIMIANRPGPEAFQQMRDLSMAKRNGTITADQQSQLTALREQQRTQQKSVHQQIEAVFTPEQKAQIEQNKAAMKQRMEQRRQQWQQRQQQKTTDGTTPPTATKNN